MHPERNINFATTPFLSYIKIISQNIQKQAALPFLTTYFHQYHIICLQEPALSPGLVPAVHNAFPDAKLITSDLQHGHSGSLIFVHPVISPFIFEHPDAPLNPFLSVATLALPELPAITLLNLYRNSTAMLETLEQYLQTQITTGSNVILVGDLNHAMQPHLDTRLLRLTPTWPWLRRTIDAALLIDLFRYLHPHQTTMTRYSSRSNPGASRIDHVLLSPTCSAALKGLHCDIQTHILTSDHHPLTLSFNVALPTPPPASSYTKQPRLHRPLTVSEQTRLQTNANDLLQMIAATYGSPDSLLLSDLITVHSLINDMLSATLSSFHPTHPHRPSTAESRLHTLIQHAHTSLSNHTRDSHNQISTLLSQIQQQAASRRRRRLHHAIASNRGIRKAIQHALGETNPPMRLALPSGRLAAIHQENAEVMTTALLNLGGPPTADVTTETSRTLHHYAKRLPTLNHRFDPPTIEEFCSYLLHSKPTKAPGPDGSTCYLYSQLPSGLLRYLHQLTTELWSKPIPPSFLQAHIQLLPKKGDPSKPSSYRPIALLNTIYKVIASHANRLLQTLLETHQTLLPEQHGFRKRHTAHDHIFQVLAQLQLHPNTYHTYVDLNKAFNSPIQPALWNLMSHQGFPPASIDLFRRLYTDAADTPIINGLPGQTYFPKRGLRQGCPLSPTLFSIYLDPLLRLIQAQLLPFTHTSLLAFADDLLLQSPNPPAHAQMLRTLHTTAKDWGLTINTDKTEIHAFGNIPPLEIKLHAQATVYRTPDSPSVHYKYLGTYLCTGTREDLLLDLLTNEITNFFVSVQPLSLGGLEMVHLINLQLIPKLQHRSLGHALSSEHLVTLARTLWTQLTRATSISPTTKLHTRYMPRQLGGLGLHHLPTRLAALQISSFCRYIHNQGPPHTNAAVRTALQTASTPSMFSLRRSLASMTELLHFTLRIPGAQQQMTEYLPRTSFAPTPTKSEQLTLTLFTPAAPFEFRNLFSENKGAFPRQPTTVYTDGSFATNSAGSAIVTNSALVLNDPDASSLAIFGRCLTPDPFAAELSALILALQSTHPESELFLISDCLGALQILQQLYTRPSFPTYRSTHAFFLNQIKALLNMREAPLHLTWLRSHQNHPLNDKADYFAKLATRLPPPPPPPPLSVAIYADKLPIEGRPAFSDLIALIPHRHDPALHQRLSYRWLKTSSPFSILPFKWSTGQFSLKGFAAHFQHQPLPCTLCQQQHGLDLLSCITRCPKFAQQREKLTESWPAESHPSISQWFQNANQTEQHYFIQTLIPHSLISTLQQSFPLPHITEMVTKRNCQLLQTISELLNTLPGIRPDLPSPFPTTPHHSPQPTRPQNLFYLPDDARPLKRRKVHAQRPADPAPAPQKKRPRRDDSLPP